MKTSEAVLKILSQLIPVEIEKTQKKYLPCVDFFSRIFLTFCGSRSLQIRALFFHTINIEFYMDF